MSLATSEITWWPTLQQALDGVALGATFAKAAYSTRKYFWFAAAFVLVGHWRQSCTPPYLAMCYCYALRLWPGRPGLSVVTPCNLRSTVMSISRSHCAITCRCWRFQDDRLTLLTLRTARPSQLRR